MKITLGFSPCPNDCFIFDAIINKRIDMEGLDFDVKMEDVETLNRWAVEGKLDCTKLSFHAFSYLTDLYQLLNSGSALGFNCGPLLISKRDISLDEVKNNDLKVAIPGKLTTANFLLSLAFPNAKNKTELVFSGIEEGVLSGEFDAGLIIHENRFTYEQKGLKKIIDLGEFWESLIHAPIPLGGIVIKRDLPLEIKQKVDRLIRKSVEYAFAHPMASRPFVREHAQEMDEAVMQKHIDLYVNQYSVDLGELGRKAVNLMMDKAQELGLIKGVNKELIV
ncbi:MAG TPA: 1,4-dihydroxy-6-naphthoate synthase [Bacteroidia bacterium]